MVAAGGVQGTQRVGAFAPLQEPVFRRIWTASLMSNFGQLILGVGVAWEMTRLTDDPSMVALVQTALMLPLMLVAVPAGAIADMFDRRRVAMSGLAVSMMFAAILTMLAWAGLTSPWVLLAFCSLIGVGVAIYSPSWQASIGEQVEADHLPAAVALGTISYNIARSFGPALGGVIVLAAGAKAAFTINAVCYLPLFLAFLVWRRRHVPPRLPPERIGRAILSGARYALHAGSIRTVLARAFLFGLVSATASALVPLIAKDLLGGNASTYGVLLGASGVGAVIGAFSISALRDRFGAELTTRLLAVASGIALVVAGFSRSLPLTCLALGVAGGANIVTIALFNISVQLSAPRWVTARALSLFSSSLTGGIAFGSWVWGVAAAEWSVSWAVIASGGLLMLMPLVARLLPLPDTSTANLALVELANSPDVVVPVTSRSGPIVIELDYDIDPDHARIFHAAMVALQGVRLRNGGFGWSLTRDLGDPSRWTERYQCRTWADYLRMRDRYTEADFAMQEAALAIDRTAPGTRHIRRLLERPAGSMRAEADSPAALHEPPGYIAP